MEAFEDLYKILGTKFDFYFLESQMAPIGEGIVKDNLGKVFEESDALLFLRRRNTTPNFILEFLLHRKICRCMKLKN